MTTIQLAILLKRRHLDHHHSKRQRLPTAQHRATLQRLGTQRGLSLFETLLVVVLIAMISTAIAVSISKHIDNSKRSLTETNARSLMQIAEGHRITDDAVECPNVDKLTEQKLISRSSKNLDAWGQAFKIECEDDAVMVVSAGKDKAFGTPDDIRVPPV